LKPQCRVSPNKFKRKGTICISERQERQPLLWLVPRHGNAIQVNSPLAADIQQDQDRRLAGLLHYGPQFPGKLVLIGNDVPGCVAWRQDPDSSSGGYGLCHGSGCVVSWPAGRERHFERALTKRLCSGVSLAGALAYLLKLKGDLAGFPASILNCARLFLRCRCRPAGSGGSHSRKESVDRSQATRLKTLILLSV
jgi:hypothetical protein